MPHNEALTNRVQAALAHIPCVEQKRMFGGIAFMVRDKMCVSVGAERIMCRIDPAIHDAVLKRKGCQAVVMKGRRYRGYVYVDVNAVSSKRDLDYWIGLALDHNTVIASTNKAANR